MPENSYKDYANNDRRNIADYYKGWLQELIVDDLKNTAWPGIIAMINLQQDFNFGTLVRTANFFNVSQVWYAGPKKWDRRGAVGTHHYPPIQHFQTAKELIEEGKKQGYTIAAIEQHHNSTPLHQATFDPKTLFILGSESEGLDEQTLAECDNIYEIPRYGSVRSLNVGTTSGIVLHQYTAQLATITNTQTQQNR